MTGQNAATAERNDLKRGKRECLLADSGSGPPKGATCSVFEGWPPAKIAEATKFLSSGRVYRRARSKKLCTMKAFGRRTLLASAVRFSAFTLRPSIDLKGLKTCNDQAGLGTCWEGFVANAELEQYPIDAATRVIGFKSARPDHY
jgi:hypothetical protein